MVSRQCFTNQMQHANFKDFLITRCSTTLWFETQLSPLPTECRPTSQFYPVTHPAWLSNEIASRAYVEKIKSWKRGHCSSNLKKKKSLSQHATLTEPSSGLFWNVSWRDDISSSINLSSWKHLYIVLSLSVDSKIILFQRQISFLIARKNFLLSEKYG